MMGKKKEKKRELASVPNSLVFIFAFIFLAMILTYVIPAGHYERILDEATGQELVIADSFTYIDSTPVNPLKMFMLIGEGFVQQAQLIFLIMFAYAFMDSLVKCGVFDSLFGLIFRHGLHTRKIIIPLIMCCFGLLGSVAGLAEETFGLFPVCVSLALALGYDEIVGASMIYLAVFTGFASATTNPYTIGVAQTIAGLPMFSGIAYRIICWIVFMGILILYTMRYAAKVKADPTQSLLYNPNHPKKNEDIYTRIYESTQKPMPLSIKLNIIVFFVTIGATIFGALTLEWYLTELTALFIIATIIVGIINRYSPNKIAEDFVDSASGTMFSLVCIGLANGICLVMTEGNIIDTILYGLSNLLNHFSGYFSGILMLFVQNLLNFFIPAGPAQAAVSMPIMAPLADLCGISRQVAVLAFQFGDGYSNLFWPTMVCMMCGMLKIPVTKWYKYISPMFLITVLAQIIMLSIAIFIGY